MAGVLPMDVLYKLFDMRYKFALRGEWTSDDTYLIGDFVTWSGSIFRAKVDNPAGLPIAGPDWEVWVAAGSLSDVNGVTVIDAQAFSSLAAADAAASSQGKQLLISQPYILSGDLTLISNIKIIAGNSITVNSGKTLTINGQFEGCESCLVVNGTLKFGPKSISEIPATWFGALDPTAATDNTTAFQAAINAALANIGVVVHKVRLPAGRYLVQGGLLAIAKNPSLSVDGNILTIVGAGGGAVTTNAGSSTTLVKTTAGKILSICENADGTYPGGGVGVVTQPLSWLRRVRLEGMNFEGDPANPNTVDAIGGRGVYRSEFRQLGFSWVRDGIRLGKRLATSQELSADSIQLDYCERNILDNVNMRAVDMMIHVLAPDTLTIKNSYLSQCNTIGGRILYIAGGNDFVDLDNIIIHPYVTGTNAALTKAIEIGGGTRGIRGRGNHIEGLNGTFLYGGSVEVVDFQNNLFYGSAQSAQSIFNITITKYGSFIFRNNNVAMPAPSVNYFAAVVIGDDGSYTQLGTCNFDIYQNKVTTMLGGATSYALTSNWSSVGIGPGRWMSPLQVIPGKGYYWYDTTSDVTRYKKTAPVSMTDGVIWGEVAYLQGSIAFPGVTVAAGGTSAVNLGIAGALPGRFVKLAPNVSTQGLIWCVNPYGGANVEVKFYNPTGSPITLASGTWLYKVELQ
jgi:hypothetical protein